MSSTTTHRRFVLNYILNFLSAILLIYLSKYIFRQYPISSVILTISNCLFSGFFSWIILQFFSRIKTNPQSSTNRLKQFFDIFIISGSFCSFITFSNLSLQYNTLGTYQLIKLQVPPTLLFIEWIQLQLGINSLILTKEKFQRDYSSIVLFAFGIIVFGTLVNTYSDLYFHPLGVLYACISVLSNALYQALVQGNQASSIYERIHFVQIQSFTSSIILFPCWPFIETTYDIKFYQLLSETNLLILLFLSGLLAFLVNSSVIWCIKDDAAIGYNMIGQLKTLLIVFIGSALFGEILTMKQIISVLLTTLGCLIYVYVIYKTKQREKSQQQLISNNLA